MNQKKINIIYFLPANKYPSGGAKAIYHHSNIFNSIDDSYISSSILHYKKKYFSKYAESLKKKINIYNHKEENFGYSFKDFKIVKNFRPNYKWLSSINIKSKNNLIFNSETDFVIFPEIVSHFAKDICIQNNIKYAILVFGAYHMYQTSNLYLLNEVYKKAEFLIDISNDTRKCLKNILPKLNKKFYRVNLSVNYSNNKILKKKQNLITCMPRKLKDDFHLLKFFLKNRLPKNWKIIDLTNFSNTQIINYLIKSKIFLSFSNFEGLGLPPLEAALAGNKVIGYTGQAGIEYFKFPIFEKIYKGDILNYSNKVLYYVQKLELDKKWHLSRNVKKQRFILLSKYSLKNEIRDLKSILSYIKKKLN